MKVSYILLTLLFGLTLTNSQASNLSYIEHSYFPPVFLDVLVKDKDLAYKKIKDSFDLGEITFPEIGKNYYLLCEKIRLQYGLGISIGTCTAVSTSADKEVQFISTRFFSGHAGAGVSLSFSSLDVRKLHNIKSIRQLGGFYVTGDTGFVFMGLGGNVKVNATLKKPTLPFSNYEEANLFSVNLFSINVSYIHISDDHNVYSYISKN